MSASSSSTGRRPGGQRGARGGRTSWPTLPTCVTTTSTRSSNACATTRVGTPSIKASFSRVGIGGRMAGELVEELEGSMRDGREEGGSVRRTGRRRWRGRPRRVYAPVGGQLEARSARCAPGHDARPSRAGPRAHKAGRRGWADERVAARCWLEVRDVSGGGGLDRVSRDSPPPVVVVFRAARGHRFRQDRAEVGWYNRARDGMGTGQMCADLGKSGVGWGAGPW